MAIISIKKDKITDFFEFSKGKVKFDLVDMMSDVTSNNGGNFFDGPGVFVYQTNFIVNVQRAIKMNAIGLRFEIFKKDPKKYPLSSTEKDALSSFEIKFEIPAFALQEPVSSLPNRAKIKVEENSVIKVLADSNLASAVGYNLTVPVLQHQQESTFKHASQVALTNGQDPASLVATGLYSSISPLLAVSLDSSNIVPTMNNKKSQTSSKNSGTKGSLFLARKALRSKRQGNQNNRVVMSIEKNKRSGEKPSQASYFNFLPTKKEYKHNLEIENDDVKGLDHFYVRITAIQERETNQEFERIFCKVYHGKEVEEFLSHPEPPLLKLTIVKIGSVTLRIERQDPTLQKVKIFRIITNPNFLRPITQDVAVVDFSIGSNLIKPNYIEFTDDRIDNVYPNKVTYRVCVINGDGTASEFTSIVVPSIKKTSDPTNSASTPVSIRALNSERGIEIAVNTLNKNILSFRLLRQEMNKACAFSESITEVVNFIPYFFDASKESSIVEVINARSVYKIVDKDVLLGRKYRYFLACRLGQPGDIQSSEEIISDEDETIIRRFPYMNVPFSIAVGIPSIAIDSKNNPTVSFVINIEETQELFNTVTKALSSAGIGQEFIANLEKDITKVKQIITFLIERYNVETGKRDSFGIFPAGEFTDSQQIRDTRKINSPVPGDRYVYVVKACLQSPEVFLQNGQVGLITDSGQEIKKQASRFSRVIYTRMGVMPPETDVRSGKDIEQLILESQIGLEYPVSVTMPSTTPNITDISVKGKTYYTQLVWRTKGNNKNISYFQIFGQARGQEMLLGAIACPDSSSSFSFNDYHMVSEIGKVTYRIKAIGYDDDSIMSKTAPTSTIKSMSISENLLTGYLYGEVDGVKMSLFINSAQDLRMFQDTKQTLAAKGKDVSWKTLMASKYRSDYKKKSAPDPPETTNEAAAEYWGQIDLPKFGTKRSTTHMGRKRDNRNIFGPVDLSSVYHVGFKGSLVAKGISFSNKYESSSADSFDFKVQNFLDESALSDDGNIETFSNSTSLVNPK